MTTEFVEKEFAKTLSIMGDGNSVDKQAYAMITGQWQYGADILPSQKLFSAFKTCPYAHAKVKSINTSKAEALEGVEAVFTYKDHDVVGRVDTFVPFCQETVYYWGESVAAVVAVDEDTAEEAVMLIDVEYEVLPFVIDVDEAMKPGATLVGRWPDTNMQAVGNTIRGDIEAGFAQADVIVEGTMYQAMNQHQTIEPQSGVSWWIGDDVYCQWSSAALHESRNIIAQSLRKPYHKVHCINYGCGDSRGSKAWPNANVPTLAALLSKKVGGRPVQVHFNRTDHMANSEGDHGDKNVLRIGAKNDGTLTAIDAQMYVSTGSHEGGVMSGWGTLTATYVCPNARFQTFRVLENKRTVAHWRGPSGHKGVQPGEVMVDVLCEKLGLNPLQFRLQRMVPEFMLDQDNKRPESMYNAPAVLQWAADSIGFSQNWHASGARTLPDGRKHGVGLSFCIRGPGSMSGTRGGTINMTHDGKAILSWNGNRASGGTPTAACHMVAEVLGMASVDDVSVVIGLSDWSSYGDAQVGSNNTVTNGGSFVAAALDCRHQLLQAAAPLLKVGGETDLDMGDGKVFVKADPSKFMTIAEVCGRITQTIIGRGYSWGRTLRREFWGKPVGTNCNMGAIPAGACEVAVDTETGEVEVLNYAFCYDIGRAAFRKGAMGQAEASLDMVTGLTFFYGDIYDPVTGALLNNTFISNPMPTPLDMPVEKNKVKILESINACGPFGCTGAGEPPAYANGCINNAVANAIGVRVDDAPMTPQTILKALGKA